MSQSEQSTGTRPCDWCAESISTKAFKCPKCTKWRKDIDEDRIKCYVWSFSAIFPAALLFLGIRNEWWGYAGPTLGNLLTSFSGLVVLAGFGLTLYYCLVYYARVSRKIGTWVWY